MTSWRALLTGPAAVLAAVVATLVLPVQPVAHAEAAAAAAGFEQATARCWPGPSGNVCSRLFYNSSTRTWRAYGATDPNPGRSISLNYVLLRVCTTPSPVNCRDVSEVAGGNNPRVYQRATTDGRGPACYWFSTVSYGAAGTTYTRNSPVGGLC